MWVSEQPQSARGHSDTYIASGRHARTDTRAPAPVCVQKFSDSESGQGSEDGNDDSENEGKVRGAWAARPARSWCKCRLTPSVPRLLSDRWHVLAQQLVDCGIYMYACMYVCMHIYIY